MKINQVPSSGKDGEVSLASAHDSQAPASALKVGDWDVDATANQLSRDGQSTRLEPKVIEVLVYLARHAGDVVGRGELLQAVWPGVIVGDDALTQAIIKLRKAFGDDARQPTYIETISKRGYRLIAPVRTAAPEPEAAAPPSPPAAPTRHPRLWLVVAGTALVAIVAVLVLAPETATRQGLPGVAGGGLEVGAETTERPTLAVLPLSNQSGDAQRDYFSDGVTYDIINALGRFSGLRVISPNSIEQFKARAPSPKAIKSELGARYFVTGSVLEAEGRLRVTVELSDAEKGVVLWSERYDGAGGDVFEIRDRIVKNIVGTLAVKVTRLEEQRAAAKLPENLEAYDLELRARALLRKSDRVANRQARALLDRSLQLAPDYAQAWLEYANAERQRSIFGWTEDPTLSLQRAEQFAQRVLALDDPGSQAQAHGLLGVVYAIAGKFEQALVEADRAIELNPNDASAFDSRGATLLYLGRTDEAIVALQTALRFNPAGRGAGGGSDHALAYYTLRRYRESVAVAESALARYPDIAFLHAIRAAALAQLGDQDAARDAAAQVLRLDPFSRVADYGTRFAKPEHTAHLQDGLRKAGL
ncbi:MAG TPA: winged helix-turn-helix domain-containing protein [Rubrivivax sp.]|nr:winged helix-turn-helix domain-containing protein [Rubrivivax sp.]